jgi:hypothetical protein
MYYYSEEKNVYLNRGERRLNMPPPISQPRNYALAGGVKIKIKK